MRDSLSMALKEPLAPMSENGRSLSGHFPWNLSSHWFVGITVVIVLFVTSIPYLYAYLSRPEDKQFMGIMLDDPDHAQYFSWMRELSQSNLAANKMTPEANRAIFFNLLWWGMGRLSVLLRVGYPTMFQLLRILAVLLFFPLVFWTCGFFLKDSLKQRIAFLVVCFSSGFGWVLVLIKYLTHQDLLFPLDVYIAEGNTFLGVLGYPHFIAAALYIAVFGLVLVGQEKKQQRYAIYAGLVALFLGWQHAYDLVSVYAVLGSFAVLLLLRDRKLPLFYLTSCLIVGFLSCSPVVYSVLLTSMDPVWKGVLKQFANAGVYTPNLLHLPILLGLPFVLAVITVILDNPFKLKGVGDRELFIRSWFLITFIIIYLPVDYQIHLLNGWQVAISILAVSGLFRYLLPLLERVVGKRNPLTLQAWIIASLFLLILPTNIYLWAWRFVDLSRHDAPYYLTQDEIEALHWISDQNQPDAVVLSSLTIGQYIPALSGTHAYLAHWAETLDFYTKSKNVETYFSKSETDPQKHEILSQGKVDYVYLGPEEKLLGASPEAVPAFLKMVYSNNQVTIYQVER
jgi:hypothetical protein